MTPSSGGRSWNTPTTTPSGRPANLLPHLHDLHTAVMTVGGWFDAEDLYGPLNIYKTIEQNCPDLDNTLVMGPWSHGDWARGDGPQVVGNISFGDGIGE